MNLGELARRVWYFLNRDRITRELEEEMRIHVEFRAESLRKHDMGESLAYATARRRFGNATTFQERSRDMWGLGSVEELVRDLRFALRRLAQRPAFSLAVISVMSLGIGATTAMFSAVDAALLRPLPFAHPEQLVTLSALRVPSDLFATSNEPHAFDLVDARGMSDVFSGVAAYGAGGVNLADANQPVRVQAGIVTGNFFSMLGVRPQLGRVFNATDAQPNAPEVVVLSHGLWQRQFGGRSIAGLRVVLSTRSYEVVGVMPQRFAFPNESDLWIPMSVPTTRQTFGVFRGFVSTTIIARITSSQTVSTASAQLLARVKLARAALGENRHLSIDDQIDRAANEGIARPLQRDLVGDRRTALLVLLSATGLLLLIACANVATLWLSQMSIRRRELNVRQLLGATRARLIRQLLVESLVCSSAGAVLGAAVAPFWLGLVRVLMPASLAGAASIGLDGRVLLFTMLLALITGLTFGLWPAFGFTRQSEADMNRAHGGYTATAANAGRVRRALVSTELALTVVLLTGAGLMLRSFSQLMSLETGMRVSHVATMEMSVPRDQTGGRPERLRRLNAILVRLSAMPGIIATGAINDLPLSGANGMGLQVTIDGSPKPVKGLARFPKYLQASDGYFKTMGISLMRGRLFTVADDSLAPKVILINQSMAQKLWPNIDPLGHHLRITGDSVPYTVIGVVADVRDTQLEAGSELQMYVPIYSATHTGMAIVARSELSERTLLAHMLDAVRSVDNRQAVYNVRMMRDVVRASVAPRRTSTILITAFALTALLLASVGVYAVVSHSVHARRRELGIRAALGATGRDLLQLISREMLWMAGTGVALGMLGAWALARALTTLVYAIDVHDWVTFVAVPIALILPIAAAALIPARHTMRVSPAEVMRAE